MAFIASEADGLSSQSRRALLRDCLWLLASYAWSSKVALEPLTVEGSTGGEAAELQEFLHEFRVRHALACAERFLEVLSAVEQQPSNLSGLRRETTRGTVRGRLDIPRYLARRGSLRSWPREFPIVTSVYEHATPENRLVRLCLEELRDAVISTPFPNRTAEAQQSVKVLARVRSDLGRRPWNEVHVGGGGTRLVQEVTTRLRRRQTGNDAAYQRLVEWYRCWTLDVASLDPESESSLVEALLAFPSGEAFWDKLFEVWCLILAAEAADELGWARVDGPHPLHEKPGIVFRYRSATGLDVDMRFQRQEPLSGARWSYRGGNALRGIPDVSLSVAGLRPVLLVDAKNRFVASQGAFTRSEETYKMMGYAENFRDLRAPAFHGVLLFPGSKDDHRILDGPDQGRLDLIAVAPELGRFAARKALAASIQDWESSFAKRAPSARLQDGAGV